LAFNVAQVMAGNFPKLLLVDSKHFININLAASSINPFREAKQDRYTITEKYTMANIS
jgi:hypothetical protein